MMLRYETRKNILDSRGQQRETEPYLSIFFWISIQPDHTLISDHMDSGHKREKNLFLFQSDSSLIIGLLDLIAVTLACEDANSKIFEVVTVADVDAEKRVHDSLVQP